RASAAAHACFRDGPLDVSEASSRLALVVIGWKLFGRDMGDEAAGVAELLAECQARLTRRMLLPVDFGRAAFARRQADLRAIVERLAHGAEPGSIAALLASSSLPREAQ